MNKTRLCAGIHIPPTCVRLHYNRLHNNSVDMLVCILPAFSHCIACFLSFPAVFPGATRGHAEGHSVQCVERAAYQKSWSHTRQTSSDSITSIRRVMLARFVGEIGQRSACWADSETCRNESNVNVLTAGWCNELNVRLCVSVCWWTATEGKLVLWHCLASITGIRLCLVITFIG